MVDCDFKIKFLIKMVKDEKHTQYSKEYVIKLLEQLLTDGVSMEQCIEHNWQNYHPDEECLICNYIDWHIEILKIRPDWERTNIFEKWVENHQLGDLPRRLTLGVKD